MVTNWCEEVEIDGVIYPSDKLNRAKEAELLKKVLNGRYKRLNEQKKKSSYVINVNAQWGAGKTYFIKRWYEDLKHNHPAVYIDAWSNDFMDSPIITVLAEINNQLTDQINPKSISRGKNKKLKNIGIQAIPTILQALVKRYGGFDIEDLFDESQDSNNDNNQEPSGSNSKKLDFSAVTKAMATQAFKEYDDYKNNITTLKKSKKDLIELSIEKPKHQIYALKKNYPAYIFIDELDRCRPTFAVEMLEAIKHIFDLNGLVIVLSTHTEELQHTIKSLYGSEFNADDYLRRFFDTKYNLNVKLSNELLKVNCDLSVLNPDEFREKGIILFPLINRPEAFQDEVLNILILIANSLKLSPRDAIQFTERFMLCIELYENNKSYDITILSILIATYMFNANFYDKIILKCENKRVEHDEDFLNFLSCRVGSTLNNLFDFNLNSHRDFSQLFYSNSNSKEIHYEDREVVFNSSSYIPETINKTDISTYIERLISIQNTNLDPNVPSIIGKLKNANLIRIENRVDGRPLLDFNPLLSFLSVAYGLNKTTLDDYTRLVELTSSFES